MMPSSLPPEIWDIVLNNLVRRDQVRLSLVSSQFCALARRDIFREVHLWSKKSVSRVVLALFTRDHTVALHVERLYIHTSRGPMDVPIWFNPDALAGMARLRRIGLTGVPFSTREGQERFNRVVSGLLPALKGLNYLGEHWPSITTQRPDPGSYVPSLEVKGLEEIKWDVPDLFTHPSYVLPTLIASYSTLVQIHIPAPAKDSLHNVVAQFLNLRFPNLSTLHLGGWGTSTPVSAALTTFLIAHPLIEVLRLDFMGPFRRPTLCRLSPEVVLGSGTLPNLRHLASDMYNVALLAYSGVLSLKTLETLDTGPGDREAARALVELGSALEAFGGMPGLTTLKLELNEGEAESLYWIGQLGHLCPAVERFFGDLNVGWAAIIKQDIFASYKNLKLKMLPDSLSTVTQEREDEVRKFVAHNSSVVDLRFYSSEYDGLVKYWFDIGRDAGGVITSIVDRLEGRSACLEAFPRVTCCPMLG